MPRPFADSVEGSRHAHMKELRPPGTNIRILFAFDPRRMTILLIGGDKTDRWKEWYEEMIPVADDLYDDHLQNTARGRRDTVSGRNSFGKLREKTESDPVRRKRMQETREAYDALLTLADLRRSRGLTQAELARLLGVSQPNVSKIEHGEEVHLSTVGDYIAALGGRLEVRAIFEDHPEHDVTIDVTGKRSA